MERAWLVIAAPSELDKTLTEFLARRLMKIKRRRGGMMDVTAGSILRVVPGGAIDWLPVRARIWQRRDQDRRTRVQARIRPRGRPRLVRRRRSQTLYERKMSSWLAQLEATLRASAQEVREVSPVPERTLEGS
jgi:hypothetical protein